MLTRSAGHLSAPFTLLLAAACLRSSLSFPAASFTMAAQDVAASGAVTPAVDAAAPCIVEAKGFEDPVLKKSRSITMALESKWQGEGVGARVRRSIGRYELPNLDPFLMLDEFSVGKPAGFPDHPHRGFETVTYMLEGKFTHEDFKGHSGTIGPGDLQWMTAGKGIMHSEVPADDSQSHGLQLWVNLAAEHKMTEPAYQELLAKDIPKVQHAGVVATVIAGEAFGVKSPVYTRTPTMYLDFTMEPGSTLHQAIPQGWNGFAYVLSGSADFNSTLGKAHHTLVLTAEEGEDGLTVTAPADAPVHFVLICGKPLGEPIVQHGPFVMNTKAEIQQAMRDFHSGTNGFEGAAQWASEGGKTFRRVEEGLQARLDDMESTALVDTPHADRMEALGGQIADELLRAGLQFQDTVVGGGAAATVGEWARVHVVGTLQDGTVFEDTHKSGTPIAFQVGSGQVVLGLDGGLAGMRVGGTRELHLPPHLAYGYRRVGDIPANSDLTFSVTLVQVGEAAAKPEQTLWEAVKDVFR